MGISKHQLTLEARKQFTNLSRITEQLLKLDDFDDSEPVETIIREAPLYLFSKEKVEAASEWVKTLEEPLCNVPLKHPIIVCDDLSAVVLLACYSKENRTNIVAMVSTYLSETDKGKAFTVHSTGELVLTRQETCLDQKINFFNWSVWDLNSSPLVQVGNRGDEVGYDALAQRRFQACIKRAIEFYAYSLKPRTIVVKEEAYDKKAAKKGKKSGKLPRDHQREVHIVLDPDEVRELQKKAKTGTHASPCAHVRRAHKRTYKHECYKNMRGQVVDIGEVKINVKEGQEIKTPRRIYHVVKVTP